VSYYVGLPLVLLAALMEASVLPLFRIAGLQPNLVLVLLVAWLTARGAREAFVLIPVGGIFLGLVDSAPLGTALLALAPVALLHEVRGSQLREGGIVLAIAFVVLMTLIYNAVYLAGFALDGAVGDPLQAFTGVAVPACFLNVLILIPTYFVLSMTTNPLRRSVYA
jgi:rod shape-determining protein MreD